MDKHRGPVPAWLCCNAAMTAQCCPPVQVRRQGMLHMSYKPRGPWTTVQHTSVAQQHRARLAVCNTDSQNGAFEPVQARHRRCLGPGGPWGSWEGPGGCCSPRGDPLGIQGQVYDGHLAAPCDGHHQEGLPTAGNAHCSCSLVMCWGDASKTHSDGLGVSHCLLHPSLRLLLPATVLHCAALDCTIMTRAANTS